MPGVHTDFTHYDLLEPMFKRLEHHILNSSP
jgi:hypothetical protein